MEIMVKEGFLQSKNLQEIRVADSPKKLLIQLEVISV
jgi:hypothetical protein